MYTYAPQWVYPGAVVDLDFRNKRYYGGFVDEKVDGTSDKGSLFTDGGAYSGIVAYTPTASGVLRVDSGSKNRITDLGLFAERGCTNRALRSRDMTNAVWVISNTTDLTAAKDQPTADNLATASGASSLTCNVNDGTIMQSVTLASGRCIYSAWVKRITGSGVISMTVDGGLSWIPVTVTSSNYVWVQIPVQTVTNPQFGFKMGTAGDKIAVDFNQCETGSQVLATSLATTPIPCTASTVVTRGNNNTYASISGTPATGNDGQRLVRDIFSSGRPFAMLQSWNGDVTTGNPNGPASLASDMVCPTTFSGGVGIGFGITSHRTANNGTGGRGNWNKVFARVNGKGSQFCINGGALSTNVAGGGSVPDYNVGSTHFNIGNNGAGTNDFPLNGSIGRVTFWVGSVPDDGQMIEWSTLTNPRDTYV